MSKEDHIEDVEAGSQLEAELIQNYKHSFLDKKFESIWKIAKIQKVANEKLAGEYEDKRQDFLVRGRKGDELQESCGFFVDNNVAEIELVASMGLQVRESEYNALGYNRQGVYVCKHADVCLQHSLVKHSGSLVMRMVMCKFVSGRPTTAIPRVASAAEFIEPTQGFDCHESVISPDPRDSLQNKFDRSQVYLYEINKLLQPSPRPRQILPYAVLHFTQNGAYIPAIDAEPTPEQRMASNARLQQVVAQMSKNSIETATPVAATPAPNPGPGLIAVPPAAAIPNVALPTAGSPTMASPTSGATLVPATPIIASSVGAPNQNGSPTEQNSPAAHSAGTSISPTPSAAEQEPNLNKVVTQLNAKLGTEIARRPGRESVHSSHRASPAVAALPAPPAPPAHLAGLHGAQPGLFSMNPTLSPHLPGHPVASMPHAIPAHMLAGQPGLLPGQPGLLPGQHPLLPGQHGILPGQAGLLSSPHMLLPNGLALHRPALPQMIPMAGLPSTLPCMLPAGLRAPLVAMPQHRPSAPEATHVPTAGYVANNVSGYTPANSAPPAAQQVGQPIPVLSNGVVTATSSAAQSVLTPASQPIFQMGGMPGVSGVGAVAGLGGVGTVGAVPGMAQIAGMPGIPGLAGVVPQSMAGLMMAPSPAGLPTAQQYALAQPVVQKLPAVQPGLVPGAALPVQNVAMAQTLKRPLADPYAIIDKRIRLA